MRRFIKAVFLLVTSSLLFSCSSTPNEKEKEAKDEVFKYLQGKVEESNGLYEQGRYEDAASLRERLLEEHPTHPYINNGEFFARIGDCWRKSEQFDKALHWYEKAIDRFSGDIEFCRKKVETSSIRDEVRLYGDLSENILIRISNVQTFIGEIQMKRKCYDKAIDALLKALVANNGNLRAFYLLGCAYDSVEGQEKNALKTFGEFLQLVKMVSKEQMRAFGISELEIEEAKKRIVKLSEKVFNK